MKKKTTSKKATSSTVGIATLSIAAVVVSAANLFLAPGGLNAQINFDWVRSARQAPATAPMFEVLSCQYNSAGRNVSAMVKNISGSARQVPVTISIRLQDQPYTLLGSVNLTSDSINHNAITSVSAPVSLTQGARYTFTCCAGEVCSAPVNFTATAAAAQAASSSRSSVARASSAPNNILGSADLDMLSPFSFTHAPTMDTFGISVQNIGDAATIFKPGQSTINAHVTITNGQRTVTQRILYFGAFAAGETKSSSFTQQPRLAPGTYTLTACVNIQTATATVAENVVETALANNCDSQQFIIQGTSSSASSSRPASSAPSSAGSCPATLTCAACIRLQCRTVQVVPALGVTSCEGMGLGLDSNLASCTATCGNVRVDVDGMTRTCS